MNQIREEILRRREDEWEVKFVSCSNNLTSKKYFRETFNVPMAELNSFFQSGRILYKRVTRQVAEQFQKELQAVGCETILIQTGISYRGKFTDEEISEALTSLGSKLTDFIIDAERLHYFQRGWALIIEDEELSNACFEFLLRFGAPIENVK